MNIIRKYKGKPALLFKKGELVKNYADINASRVYGKIADFYKDFESYISNNKAIRFHIRGGDIMFITKDIFFTKSKYTVRVNSVIAIPYRNYSTKEVRIFINNDYLVEHPTHVKFVNKYIKEILKLDKKQVDYVTAAELYNYMSGYNVTLHDVNKQHQHEIFKNFLNYKKWKIPQIQESLV